MQNSVESIAAVSERGVRAGAEEVSASTEKQTASVEQMSAAGPDGDRHARHKSAFMKC